MAYVVVVGHHQAAAKFRAAAARLKAQQSLMLQQGATITQEAIVSRILREGLQKSGALVQSGRVFGVSRNRAYVGFGRGLRAESDGSNYAWYLELGTEPHPIYSRTVHGGLGGRMGLLSFEWEKSPDGWFVGPMVSHPGNRPYRFVRHGTEDSFIPIMMLVKEKLMSALMLS